MTYQQTIDYLYDQLPMFSRIGSAAYKEDLHNTIALCKALGNPQQKFKSIHIAGTNGKGSTSHMLAAILQQAGYKTGLYTSPHLKDFKERIKINGEMVSEPFIVDFVERTKTLTEKIQPSFFELTVAMAFDYFAGQKVDIAIIETGLGGRLDSTNIITPVLSIITNIGYDHMNILGDTLEKIAYEKAGIIKQSIPVIIGEYIDETKPVFEIKAAACGSPIYFAQDEFEILEVRSTMHQLECIVKNIADNTTESYVLDLNGLYQAKNLRGILCVEAALLKLGFVIKKEAKKFALGNVKKMTGLHGRWEVIAANPMIVLDVAHNEDGVRQVLEQAEYHRSQASDRSRENNIHFVMGVVKDKEVSKILSLLPKSAHYYFTAAHIPRALPPDELKFKAAENGLTGNSFDDVNKAMQAAKQQAEPDDIIIIFGSVFLVGEVETAGVVN